MVVRVLAFQSYSFKPTTNRTVQTDIIVLDNLNRLEWDYEMNKQH